MHGAAIEISKIFEFLGVYISGTRGHMTKSTKIAVFEANPVEISEVLAVEISTARSGLISTFTGKKN